LSLPEIEATSIELSTAAEEYLLNPAKVWHKASFKQKVELQWFEFPKGIILEDGKFRTNEITSVFKVKDLFLSRLSLTVPSKRQQNEHPTFSKKLEEYRGLLKRLECLKNILKNDPP
jgi:hypothetical protein